MKIVDFLRHPDERYKILGNIIEYYSKKETNKHYINTVDLNGAFTWMNTPQNHKFWEDIYENSSSWDIDEVLEKLAQYPELNEFFESDLTELKKDLQDLINELEKIYECR